jgi:hypothetical protein
VRAELIDVEAEPAVPRRIVHALLADLQARRSSPFERAIYLREVPEAHVGLLYVEGRLVGELAPGVHAFWKIGRSVTTEVLDVRVKALEVGERRWATFARCAARGQIGHRQNVS